MSRMVRAIDLFLPDCLYSVQTILDRYVHTVIHITSNKASAGPCEIAHAATCNCSVQWEISSVCATGFIPSLVPSHVYTSKTRVAHVRSEAYRERRRAETPARNGTEVVVGEFAIPIGHSAALSNFGKFHRGTPGGPVKSRYLHRSIAQRSS